MPQPESIRRGRVVMLCHTDFGPDSRVVKQARSMSERGWEVIVLATGNVVKGLDLRGARVLVIEVDRLLLTPRQLVRTPLLRPPLTNPAGVRRAEYFAELRAAQIDDLRYRRLAIEARRPGLSEIRLKVLRGRTLLARVRHRISVFRLDRTRKLLQRRRAAVSPIDRATRAFWQFALGKRAWRRLWPGIWAQERAYGPVINRLRPDIIHANDFMMLAVGARAKLRAQKAGRDLKLVWDAREYLPGMSPWSAHPDWSPAHIALEREFAPYADAVVTVSEPLGDLLRRDYHLSEQPAVVLNAPAIQDPPVVCSTDVRTECGLAAGTPLIVYSGAAAPQRGLEVMIEALPHLPGVHTAFVVLAPHRKKVPPYVQSLLDLAESLGVRDRVHILRYVGIDEVVSFLSTGDLGVFPGLPFLNHTISLITKFLEYSHARLPIVVSNLKHMADTVRETGQGEVFEVEDVASYVVAIKKVLADRDRYVAAYDDPGRMAAWEWSQQADVLEAVYTQMMNSSKGRADG